jgi:hypothetical protein
MKPSDTFIVQQSRGAKNSGAELNERPSVLGSVGGMRRQEQHD